MSHKARIIKLEKRAQPVPKAGPNITDEMYSRSMEALAAAMTDITGNPATRADVEQVLRELQP
jgi:hypothetical protein